MDLLNKTTVQGKDDLLMQSLINFYKNKKYIQYSSYYSGKSNISLRIIDWFVTNYAKKNTNQNKKNFYLDYKSQLKAYSKKQFDPFCRRDRISFIYEDSVDGIETTVGQLNFFRWALKTKILEYIEKNITDIEKDMNQSVHSTYKKKSPNSAKKRQKLMNYQYQQQEVS